MPEHHLSSALALRLTDAVRFGGQELASGLAMNLVPEDLSVSTMVAAIGADTESTFARLSQLFALSGSRTNLPAITGWGLDGSLRFGGYAFLPDGTRPHLFARAGGILAIDELLLRALTNPGFFNFDGLYDPLDDHRSRAPLHVLRIHADGPARFHDYSWLDTLEPPDSRIALLTTMPLTPWRLQQFELLRELALQWLCLHEAAHWLCGHLGFANSATPGTSAGLQLADPFLTLEATAVRPTPLEDALNRALSACGAPQSLTAGNVTKCLEYQADFVGFQLLEFFQRRPLPVDLDPFRRYELAMTALGLPDFFEEAITLSEAARARALLIAAGAVMLLVERASRRLGDHSDYPLPLARLLNLQTAIITTSSFTKSVDGERMLSPSLLGNKEFITFVEQALARSVVDLDVLTQVLDLDPFIDKTGSRVVHVPLTHDLLALFEPDVQLDTLQTDAGREFFSLYETNNQVCELCEQYGLIDPDRLQSEATEDAIS